MANAHAPGELSPYPAERKAWYVVGVLFVVTLFSQLDRQLPALLVQPLRAEFGISDTGFSLLQGYAFAVVYTLAGLPLGRLIDHANRRNLVLIGMLVWSAMTFLSGFAETYRQLLIARMGVGIGEAVLGPAAFSIIADYVRPERRGRALAVYYLSLAAGSGASLFLGGLVLRLTPTDGMEFPFIGPLDSWRWVFILAGAPGLLLAFLMLSVREPVRRDVARWGDGQTKEGSIGEFLTYLTANARTFSRALVFPAVVGIAGTGAMAWAPAFFERRFAILPGDSGLVLGIVQAGSALIGIISCGLLSDRWRAQRVPAARLRVTLVGWLIMAPGLLTWPLVDDPMLSFLLLTLNLTGICWMLAAAPVMIQEIVPNRMRGQAIALYQLVGGLVGIGFGPMSVALITDNVFGDDKALPYSLALIGMPVVMITLWLCWSGLRPYAASHRALDPSAP